MSKLPKWEDKFHKNEGYSQPLELLYPNTELGSEGVLHVCIKGPTPIFLQEVLASSLFQNTAQTHFYQAELPVGPLNQSRPHFKDLTLMRRGSGWT